MERLRVGWSYNGFVNAGYRLILRRLIQFRYRVMPASLLLSAKLHQMLDEIPAMDDIKCQKCKQPIDGNPPRCPHCRALRPDIQSSKGTFYILLIPGLYFAYKAAKIYITPPAFEKDNFLGDTSDIEAFFWALGAAVFLIPAIGRYLSISRRLGKWVWL